MILMVNMAEVKGRLIHLICDSSDLITRTARDPLYKETKYQELIHLNTSISLTLGKMEWGLMEPKEAAIKAEAYEKKLANLMPF